MAKQTVNLGSSANDGTGDPLRSAFDKINDNFDELYLYSTATTGNNITITGNTIATDNTNGNIILDPNGVGDIVIATGAEFQLTDHVDNGVVFSDSSGNLTMAAGFTFDGTNVATTGTIDVNSRLKFTNNIISTQTSNDPIELDPNGTGAVNIFANTNVTGGITVSGTTASTSATTGALTVAGGAGIAADLSVGDDVRLISDAAVLSFGANSDVTLTHVHNAGLTLSVPATADNSFPTFNLSAGDNDIAANDVLGQINFQAPAEGAGTDAILVAAGIAAISEGDFSASNNATKLSFQTGASEAAAEKMSLSSAGALDVTGDITGATLNADGDTSAGDNAAIGYTAALGLILTGQGSTNDITLVNDADATVLAVPTGTVNVTTAGRLQPTTFSSGVVTLVATGAITAALHAGKTLLLGEVGGNALVTLTLPAATGTGDIYKFIVSVVNTSNYVIKVADATDTIDGQVIVQNDTTEGGTASVIGWKAGGTDDTITLNGTTTGGVSIGDYVELIDIAANQYTVSGMLQASGTEATPFSATVS